MSPRPPSRLLSLAACTLLAAAPAARGQEVCPEHAASVALARASVGVRAFPDRLAGGGPDYRLELRPGGVRFTPALGSRAERALPVELALEGVTVGGVALPIAPGTAPETQGTRLFYRRGAGVTERYDLRLDGVEQSFALAELPPGRGEVVVRLRLASELPLASCDADAGLLLARRDLGGVRIGGVVGVDAAGRSAPGSVRLAGAGLELRLPADFVAGAALPLTLDPLITAEIPVNTGGPDDGDPDVAFDGTGSYLVAWTRTFASGDTEIRGQRVDPGGTPLGGLLLISDSDENTQPAVGLIHNEQRFVVAWEHRSAAAPDSDVFVATVETTSGVISAEEPAGVTGADEIQADVGTDYSSCLVVWREVGAGIRGAEVQLDAFGDPSIPALKTFTTGLNDRDPALGGSGSGGYALLVWSTGQVVNDQLKGVRLFGTAVLDGPFTIDTSFEPHGAPDCAAANDDDYMVVWTEEEPGIPVAPAHDVLGARVLFPGNEALVEPAFVVEGQTGDDEHSPAIAYAGYEYLVAYLDEGPMGDDVRAKAIDAMTGEVLELLGLDLAGSFSAPALAGEASEFYGSAEDRVLAVYSAAGSAGGDVLAALVEGAGGIQEELDLTGCFLVGEPHSSAAHSPNAEHRQELWEAEPGAACILGIGWAEEQIDLGAGTLVPDLDHMTALYAGVADADGRAGVNVPIPAGLAGETFWFQWALIPAGAPCTSLGIDLADALELTLE